MKRLVAMACVMLLSIMHAESSNDPNVTSGQEWGVWGGPGGSSAMAAWTSGHVGSPDVYVGVLDTGIDFNHPDLAANIWLNPFDPPDGVDNDGNGYVDDGHGWDFCHNDNTVFDGPGAKTTTDSHGTHIAGIIGAAGGNGLGGAGVNWHIKMISLKFNDVGCQRNEQAAAALDYLTDLKTRHGLKIVAVNNSWVGHVYSAMLHGAIIRAANAGILFVVAAGNSGTDNDHSPAYPANYSSLVATAGQPAASYEAVISVANIDANGVKYFSTNVGATKVHLGAPGTNIWSTTVSNGHAEGTGTSQATAFVTGAAALYASVHPEASAAAIRTAVLDSAVHTPTPSLAGITVTGGRLNIAWMLGLPATPPPPHPPPSCVKAC